MCLSHVIIVYMRNTYWKLVEREQHVCTCIPCSNLLLALYLCGELPAAYLSVPHHERWPLQLRLQHSVLGPQQSLPLHSNCAAALMPLLLLQLVVAAKNFCLQHLETSFSSDLSLFSLTFSAPPFSLHFLEFLSISFHSALSHEVVAIVIGKTVSSFLLF